MSPDTKRVKIDKGHVARSMFWAAGAGAIVLVGLSLLLLQLDGVSFAVLLFAEMATLGFLGYMMFTTYRRALEQSIHLSEKEMVFDYVVGVQTFRFETPRAWSLKDDGGYWRIESRSGGGFKRIPKSAFPSLLSDIEHYYGTRP